MGRRRRYTPPFEVEIEKLGKKGVGVGTAPDGTLVEVKPAPPGGRILFAPQRKNRGKWKGRRIQLVRPPKAYVEPVCEVFGLCGGCVLQELSLEAQREAKFTFALEQVAEQMGISLETLNERVQVEPLRGSEQGFFYRNKVEFSFGNRRMLSQQEFDARESIHGRFLGFHAYGRFDRIADTSKCWLIADEANEVFAALRKAVLTEEQQPPWDNRSNQGFWRHAMLRHGFATNELLLTLFTASAKTDEEVESVQQVVEALQTTELSNGASLVGIVWVENEGVADVARGTTRQIWGRDWFEEHLKDTRFRISTRAFFQTSKAGAEILYDTIGEALGDVRGTLYDLYCGIGSIGLYLSSQFDKIIGVEEVEDAIEHARENAKLNGFQNVEYHAAKMEDTLDVLQHSEGESRALIFDPPRAGLHPKVVRAAAQAKADVLIYVACEPGSLGRDAAILELGGWVMTQLWTVDLFPQTGHIEMVARFVPRTA